MCCSSWYFLVLEEKKIKSQISVFCIISYINYNVFQTEFVPSFESLKLVKVKENKNGLSSVMRNFGFWERVLMLCTADFLILSQWLCVKSVV